MSRSQNSVRDNDDEEETKSIVKCLRIDPRQVTEQLALIPAICRFIRLLHVAKQMMEDMMMLIVG